MSVLESRYAQALLGCASSPEESEAILQLLQDFVSMLNQEELRQFLLSPAISSDIKKETVEKLLPPDAPKMGSNFLRLLTDKERLEHLPGITTRYQELKAQLRQTLTMTIFSAQALDSDQLEELEQYYRNKYGAQTAQVENRVDPSLLGGVCVQIGDLRVDDTLQSRLRGLYTAIAGK